MESGRAPESQIFHTPQPSNNLMDTHRWRIGFGTPAGFEVAARRGFFLEPVEIAEAGRFRTSGVDCSMSSSASEEESKSVASVRPGARTVKASSSKDFVAPIKAFLNLKPPLKFS